MAHPNEDLLRRAYGEGEGVEVDVGVAYQPDLENIVQPDFADDIVSHVSGTSQISGDFRGRDEFISAMVNVGKLCEGTLTNEIHEILASDTHGIVLMRSRAQRAGRSLDALQVHVWHIADGKLTEVWGVPVDQAAFDAFFA